MSLQFAILTALAERQSTGIELTRRFDRSFGYFWTATHQQIYRELDRLSSCGWVEATTPPDRPGRGQPKRFAITTDGISALQDWLHGIDEPAPVRESIAIRLRAAAVVGDIAGVRAAVTRHLEVHEQNLATYRDIDARDFSAPETETDILRHLMLKQGLRSEQMWADWCREVLSTIDRLPSRRDPSEPA
ncbi:PadR family transcriptional regulator [Mycobacterium sp. CBMA293]|uniref:PadR family transcriptional regulator n=1 Tax=unclassified Mycolicibacterium TaxID=2636767 RepID=UPI0012DFB1A4|nr:MULTISPECIES: PadR family transcriptional regulator [unclassified Mycolicibacterium]MUL49865.1 PadR family transcriptional regulator [Mycolicibacterium sp. CBMA 360]MUL61501.1 PadR family transcriptional regulator [Mycolicibacterium sp. CBMA 335]MUL74236.1 PadR family transcriptional regulator [Mycolicibacterium sp. CBMA 311]MUL97138.1 PadR family transcriptional regulator [Mycolicibacterium sp. CBMA 230]MUM08201.1 PadR family transcriptional regulator [Mycolicibacterium sp. CBMA 213]